MLMEFFRESISQNYKVFAVCSDTKVGTNVGNDLGSEDISQKDVYIPVISNPQALAMQVIYHLDKNHKVIIFSTYQSIDIVIKAQKIFKYPFSILINDEAHRTAGYEKFLDQAQSQKVQSVWQKTHDDSLLKARFRLYLTATPRIYSDKAKDKMGEKDLMLYSMDDESVFGKEIYSLRFDEAINRGILCDYCVLITFANKDTTTSITNAKDKQYKADDISKMIGLHKAILKQDLYLVENLDESKDNKADFAKENPLESFEVFEDSEPMKRIVAFHHSIANSKFFVNNFSAIDEAGLNSEYTEHIDGTDNASQKAQKLSWLKEPSLNSTFKVLSNAKCLTEGIDVPNLDGVAFFDPRDSVVDIVQAVGRVMRKSPNKKYGYIILPISLSQSEILQYDKVLNTHAFKGVWKILKALRSHDERLVDISRINQVVKVACVHSKSAGGFTQPNAEKMTQQSLFALNELATNLKNAIPKNLGDLTYWELYANKVGTVMRDLSVRIDSLLKENTQINALFSNFCNALKANLNSSFDTSEAITLIAQHIITKPIFNHIFPHLDFASFDKVACELENLYTELDKLGLSAEIKDLEKFYTSIQKNAEYAQSDKSKQDLIRNLYDSLFKSAFKKTQEKLGIVYTPIEVVDFIIHSVQYALNKHFGKSLGDKGIHIYDPFTGTGSFITRLIQSGLLDSNLAHKYENEIWANEITLLGYYIAQINITATYHKQILSLNQNCHTERSKVSQDSKDCRDFSHSTNAQNDNYHKYKLLDNLLFTDTFNTYTHDTKGFKGQGDLLSTIEYLKANFTKIQELKQTDFKVIFGNPPYSTGQNSANDNNKNTSYPALESRIANTYAKLSHATNKGSNYDSYKMAIRYASDRIENNGIVAFVTNGSFIDGNADSGLRACLEAEFDYIYIFNLRGNARLQGEARQKEGGGVFDSGSRTPVAISLFIKCDDTSSLRGAQSEASATKQSIKAECAKAKIFYYDIGDYLDRQTKLNIIQNFHSIEGIERQQKWQIIHPNKDYDWINQRDYSYLDFMPIADKASKFKPLKKGEMNIFEAFSMGIGTSRDAWVYNFSLSNLESNMQKTINVFNVESQKFKGTKQKDYEKLLCFDKTKISWSSSLIPKVANGIQVKFDKNKVIVSMYRPFCKQFVYYDENFIHRQGQMPNIYPNENNLPNLVICLNDGVGNFGALITDSIVDNHLFPQTQCFPLYYYESESDSLQSNISPSLSTSGDKGGGYKPTYHRKDAIRDEALKEVQKIYKDTKITKEDMFYYIYALLNHRIYKQKYKDNLSKMLPRIPYAKDFWAYEKLGRELANLHLQYESFAECSRALALPKAKISAFSGIFGANNDTKQMAKDLLSEFELKDFTIKKMSFEKKGQKDTIIFNDKIAIVNIPPKAYNYIVNGKSAIEWIMERYQVKIDKDSGIKNDPNLYECKSGALAGLNGGKYALYLLLSVIEMSAQSVEIIEAISELDFSEVEK